MMISTSGPVNIKEEFLTAIENQQERDQIMEGVNDGTILVLEHEWWFLYSQDSNTQLTQLAVTFSNIEEKEEDKHLISEEQKRE
jgi:ribosome-associated toxin RatA of RatAB toxin-antitoxin module